MTDSAPGGRVDRGSRLTAFFKRRIRRYDRQDSSRLSLKVEVSPANSVASSNPPATSQEISAAINAVATSTISITATGSTGTPIESHTGAIEEIAEPDLWSRAYQELDKKTKEWIEDASIKESGEERAQDLIKIVREREEVYKDETPKLKVGNQEILWRDCANRVVAWVTAIGDISNNFALAPSSVVWSAVKVLLKVRKAISPSGK